MLPVIDIGSLFSGNDQERLKTSLEIENALKTTGTAPSLHHFETKTLAS